MADKGVRDLDRLLALTLRVGRVYRIASFLPKMWTKPPPNPKTCLTYATPQSRNRHLEGRLGFLTNTIVKYPPVTQSTSSISSPKTLSSPSQEAPRRPKRNVTISVATSNKSSEDAPSTNEIQTKKSPPVHSSSFEESLDSNKAS